MLESYFFLRRIQKNQLCIASFFLEHHFICRRSQKIGSGIRGKLKGLCLRLPQKQLKKKMATESSHSQFMCLDIPPSRVSASPVGKCVRKVFFFTNRTKYCQSKFANRKFGNLACGGTTTGRHGGRKEVGRCCTRAESQGMYIMYTSARCY